MVDSSPSDQDQTASEASFPGQVIRSLLYSGVGTTVSKVLNVVALLVVLKWISASAFGIASIVLAIFSILKAVTELGLGVAIVQAQDITREEIDSLFWLSLGASGTLYLLLAAAAPLAGWFYEEPQLTALLQVYGLSLVVFSFYFVPKNLLTKELSFGRIVFAENASLLGSSLVMVALAYYGFGAWSIIVGELGNRVGRLGLFQIFRPYWPHLTFNWTAVQPRVSFGLYATGSRLLYNFYMNADYLLVGRIFGPEAVGIYTMAYRIISDPVKTLAFTINDVAYPAFSKLQDELDRLRTYFFTIARANLSLIGLVLVIIAVHIEELLVVGGYEKYFDAIPLVYIFSFVGVFRAVAALVPQLLNAVGQARLNFFYAILSSILMPLAFLVGGQFSLNGVAWAWVVTYPLVVGVLLYFSARVLQTSFGYVLRRVAPGGVVLLPTLGAGLAMQFFTDAYLPDMPILALGIGTVVTLGVGLGLIALHERKAISVIRGHYSAEEA
ncbi:O-antigen/teichoic acid export membrane protein [Salinibacter ruber]|uniref:O-antigen/teichoic acid export membrane protein n=1 Tax=Salinibacter ruber TaxID=146919 RepID=A0A9X2TD74_9BACT|nr:O-antigen/teichoic acid export membrane protein [Salinibacter ruber]MCS3682466.1 O-antigen/teichoic acid export membrane protein [Salinibacter ruber]